MLFIYHTSYCKAVDTGAVRGVEVVILLFQTEGTVIAF